MKVQEIINKKVLFNHEVNGIKINSKEVEKNDIFIALKGNNYDGFDFILEALNNKAKTIISNNKKINNIKNEEINKLIKKNKVNIIYNEEVEIELAKYLKKFYQDISKDLFLIGITGTNGKTTITTLLYKYFRYLGKDILLIGTNGIYLNDEFYETKNTTPDLITIYKYLFMAKSKGIKYVVMEVSSQGIKERRVKGLNFKIGLLTNITLDHLDYHKTFEDYYYTKILFLNTCETVIINKDMNNYYDILKCLNTNTYTYGKNNAFYNYSNLRLDIFETSFDFSCYNLNDFDNSNNQNNDKEDYFVCTSLLGEYNASNICGFMAILDIIDKQSDKGNFFNLYTLSFLKKKITIDGRFEVIRTNRATVIIDFAHTPDGIKSILSFINLIKTRKIITIIGMGGDRDKSKRPIVGTLSNQLSDFVIYTSDNPRTENPNAIIADITKNLTEEQLKKTLIEPNRREAINQALRMALIDDIVVILGKGNEKYQIIGKEYFPYSDKEEVYRIINKGLDSKI